MAYNMLEEHEQRSEVNPPNSVLKYLGTVARYHFNPGEVAIGGLVRLSNLAVYPSWQIPSQRENLINRGWEGGHQCLKHYTVVFL